MKLPQRPRLPGTLWPSRDPAGLEDEETYRQRHYSGPVRPARELRAAAFELSAFSDIDWTGSEWGWVRFADVRVERCNLAGAQWEHAGWRRVELRSSRLLGLQVPDLHEQHVTVSRCDARLSSWFAAKLTMARFEHCDLREARFTGADLRGAVFAGCDLSKADFHDAKLEGADLRGAKLDGIRAGLKELQGAIIATVQLPSLAHLLGVTIHDA